MEKPEKRRRNWDHAQTMALAMLKKENEGDGPLVWKRIAQTLSNTFPKPIITDAQCRRRWDTLVKVYKRIEDLCDEDHRKLDEGKLASIKLATKYHQDWYDIVKYVCSQRGRKERCDRDLMLAKRSTGSHSVELPEHPPNKCSTSTSKSVTHHRQSTPETSTNAYAQVSSGPSLDVDKLSPEEEDLRLQNFYDGLMLEAPQPWQQGQVPHETFESANLPPHTSQAGNGAQLKAWPEEPQEDDIRALLPDWPPFTAAEVEVYGLESELTELTWNQSNLEPTGVNSPATGTCVSRIWSPAWFRGEW